jgi:hypothetical protein
MNLAITHHHLELISRWATMIFAHPQRIKARMFGAASESQDDSDAKIPRPGPESLQDL